MLRDIDPAQIGIPLSNLHQMICRGLSRIKRHGVVMALVFAYLFTFVSHTHVDDGSHASGAMEISFSDSHSADDSDRDDTGNKAGHHCHAWFLAMTASPVATTVSFEIGTARFDGQTVLRRGVQHGIDPPPPKFLT